MQSNEKLNGTLGIVKKRLWVNKDTTYFDTRSINSSDLSIEKSQTHTQVNSDDDFRITAKFVICISLLFVCLFLSAFDYTAIGNVMGTISSDLNGTTSQTEWIGNGYALAACVAQLPIASLSDTFGRRNVLMVTLVMFLVGTVTSGCAQNMNTMITGRIIQGIGAAGNLVLPEVVLADTVPLRLRGLYYGFAMLVWSFSSSIAPVIAGAFAEYSTWRWLFWLNIILGGPVLVFTPFAIDLKPLPGTLKERVKHIDYIGALLSTTSVTSMLIGLSRGDSIPGMTWSHWSVILPLVLGGCGIIGTGVYEYIAKPKVPMFNIRVFGNLSAAICYLHNVIQGIVNMASVYFLPTFFQACKNMGELESGASIIPLSLAGPPFGLIVGWMVTKTGHYQIINIVLWAIACAGMGLMTTISADKNVASLVCMQILASVGVNSLYNTLSVTANATNPPELWTDSTAMMSFCRSVGDAFGTAIGGAIFASQMKSRLAKLTAEGIDLEESSNFLSIVDYLHKIDSERIRNALIDAFAGSLQTLFVVLTIFCAVGVGTCLIQKEYTLDTKAESKQGINE